MVERACGGEMKKRAIREFTRMNAKDGNPGWEL
jgi:hypothetical protein